MSLDRLELSVDGGRVKIFVQIGHYDKTLIIGQVIVVVIMVIMMMIMVVMMGIVMVMMVIMLKTML